ncbi:glycosyltransferase family 4 protein [Aureimonas mangrovi]|uniref:glycosyltransferase family 4 protein n=1 Tax=Aureimonas mangrovi TaxID=2758041 RepID=UPI00163DB9B0|nr:glycosyltransferase family 1 protein [Aureimonas mangrovi]
MRIGVDARNLVTGMNGIARVVAQTSRALAAAGCDVRLYLPEPPHAQVPQISGVCVRTRRFRGPIARVLWGHGALPKAALDEDVDVLWGPAHRLPGRLDRRIARVVTIHDLVWVHAPETMRRRGLMGERLFMGSAVRGADIVTAVSASTAEDIGARFGALEQPVAVVHPGVDMPAPLAPDADAARARHGIDRPYALFVGTLEPRKNLPRLLAAYARLPAAIRQRCMLVLAGGHGWGERDLGALVTELGLAGDVRLTGFVPDADLAALYAGARFLAMPSLYEGFGLPIAEAHARGVPVLTSDRSSMPEVAGEAGLLIDPTDETSIAAGLGALACDDALHANLAAHARKNAARFTWRRSADALIEVFERAIAMRKGR